jgi:hypothetical protein
MTSLRQLDKLADQWFSDQMRRRGFAVEPKFVFWRKRGPLYDMFMPNILKGAPPYVDPSLRIYATIWSPWADHPDGEFIEFPPSSYLIGGELSEVFPKLMNSGESFSIGNEDQIGESFKRILVQIDKALPWFLTVNSYESYSSYIGVNGFHPVEEYQTALRIGIMRGFEREKFY